MARGIALLRAQYGLQAEVAKGLGVTRAAVTKWRRVPADRLIEVERITGIPREELRPDLFVGRACTKSPEAA
jgi:DNA-binding transcriptional regulator YdaS (Cro superfamily)